MVRCSSSLHGIDDSLGDHCIIRFMEASLDSRD